MASSSWWATTSSRSIASEAPSPTCSRIIAGVPGRQPARGSPKNFRSLPGILDFVNALFADTFTEPGSALRAGAVVDHDGPPAVEFLWGSPQVDSPGEKPDVGSRRKDEANRLARHLKTRLDEGWMVRDQGSNGLRRANQGDIAFLFRSLSDASDYEQALVAEGMDYHVVGGSGFFAQQEVLDLINVLTAVEDPFDAVSLAGALRSPFFSLSDDALYWISTERGTRMPLWGLDRCGGPWPRNFPKPIGLGPSGLVACSRIGEASRIDCRSPGWWTGSWRTRAMRRR